MLGLSPFQTESLLLWVEICLWIFFLLGLFQFQTALTRVGN